MKENDPSHPNPLAEVNRQRNYRVRDAWDRFASHRQEVTQLLLKAAEEFASQVDVRSVADHDVAGRVANGPCPCLRLAVLGAGNLNDIDLQPLLQSYVSIDLFDLDGAAMRAGLQRQALVADSRVMVHEVEITGLADLLIQCRPQTTLNDPVLQQCFARTETVDLLRVAEPFDVTTSICLVTQLIDGVVQTLGERHEQGNALSLAIRDQHLDQLCRLTRPGGRIVFITDVISSTTYPNLAQATPRQLPSLVAGLIQHGNFFTGTNPFAIRAKLQTDPRYQGQIGDVRLFNPWLWNLGPRYYAVCAMVMERI
jgi:hypothetical protein